MLQKKATNKTPGVFICLYLAVIDKEEIWVRMWMVFNIVIKTALDS